MTAFLGRGARSRSEEGRQFFALALVRLPKMLREIPMSSDGGLVLKLILVFGRDCVVEIEPDAIIDQPGL